MTQTLTAECKKTPDLGTRVSVGRASDLVQIALALACAFHSPTKRFVTGDCDRVNLTWSSRPMRRQARLRRLGSTAPRRGEVEILVARERVERDARGEGLFRVRFATLGAVHK
jgi:hypothetical protein